MPDIKVGTFVGHPHNLIGICAGKSATRDAALRLMFRRIVEHQPHGKI
jgi:hypothetical protein